MDIDELDGVIDWLVGNAPELPTLPDMADADQALMYLRHLRAHLIGGENV